MSNLNVTKGNWFVVDNGDGSASIQFNEDGEHIVDYVYNKNDAYLIAQAKNMYEQLQRTDKLLKESNLDRKLGCKLSDEINEILNACKPPDE